MFSHKIYLLVLLIPLTFHVSAQDTLLIKPGNHILKGTLVKPYINRWRVTYISQDGKSTPNKIWTDYAQIIELNGKKYFHRVQDLYDPGMNLLDTWINMTEYNTLIPVSFSTINPEGGFSYYQFDGNKIKGATNLQTKDHSIKKIDVTLDEKVFDWNLYGMLLIGLPFEKGLIVKIPYFNSGVDAVGWLNALVIGKESIEMYNGLSKDVWKVETDKGLIFWLSEEAPYVLKLELAMANKAKLLWEVY